MRTSKDLGVPKSRQIASECQDGYHKACPGGPPKKGKIGIMCLCPCHGKR